MRGVEAGEAVLAWRLHSRALLPAALVAGLMLALAGIDPLLHVARIAWRPDPWLTWPLTPGVMLPVLLAAWLYLTGQPPHPTATAAAADGYARLRHCAFFTGLAALVLALQSPLEPISDHLFFMHQIEHMLLRTAAPMLLVLAAPQAALLRGMPSRLRRRVMAPVLGSRSIRVLSVLSHPAAATGLFVGTTYFWMVPRYHDLAILDERIHYLWHISLLLSGLVFFWRILDPRSYPRGPSLGVRLFMFWLASTGNILLGSYLSFKHQVLYSAYSQMGRLWAINPALDENLGGLIMWIPGSMMFAGTAMLMIYRWAQAEERSLARRGVPGASRAVRAAEFVWQRRSANRKMALGLVCFMITVVVVTFTTVLVYHAGDYPSGLTALAPADFNGGGGR